MRKMVKIIAIRCYISKLKCTRFDFGWVFAPKPAEGAHSAPQIPYLDSRVPTSEGRGKKEGKKKCRSGGEKEKERRK